MFLNNHFKNILDNAFEPPEVGVAGTSVLSPDPQQKLFKHHIKNIHHRLDKIAKSIPYTPFISYLTFTNNIEGPEDDQPCEHKKAKVKTIDERMYEE